MCVHRVSLTTPHEIVQSAPWDPAEARLQLSPRPCQAASLAPSSSLSSLSSSESNPSMYQLWRVPHGALILGSPTRHLWYRDSSWKTDPRDGSWGWLSPQTPGQEGPSRAAGRGPATLRARAVAKNLTCVVGDDAQVRGRCVHPRDVSEG